MSLAHTLLLCGLQCGLEFDSSDSQRTVPATPNTEAPSPIPGTKDAGDYSGNILSS